MGFFLNHENEEQKLFVFHENKHKWIRIREDVVKWVNEQIPEWNEAQPEWWDARRKAMVPDWAVHDKEVLKSIRSEEVVKVQEQRRKSIVNTAKETETVQPPHNAGAIRRRTILADAKKLASEND